MNHYEGRAAMADESSPQSMAANSVPTAVGFDEILTALESGGCRAAAERIRDLDRMNKEEGPDEPPIVVESLRQLALFLLNQHQLVEPQIALGPDALMCVEWNSREGDVVVMEFLPDGTIDFAGVSSPQETGSKARVRDQLPHDATVRAVLAVHPFRDLLTRQPPAP